MIIYSYDKLLEKINRMYGTQAHFANVMNLSERSISLKLNNKIQFKQDEIIRAINLLNIPANEISLYFFNC